MKKEDLFKEIGLIDENLIEAAGHNGTEKRKKGISKKWVVLVACLVLYSSTASALLATEYYKNQNSEPYIRYLKAEDMELQPATKYDAEKFLHALKSDNNEYVYIAINRLVETFNNSTLRVKALKELQPFLKNENQKIADAAAFAVDILSKSYKSPYIVKLADGSMIFTLFNNYSDYGSQNVIWRIKDNKLNAYFSFSTPSMYIKKMIPSPNHKLVAIVTCSNKSDFIQISNIEEGMISPELIESARVKYGAQKEIDTWIRTDHENYSNADNLVWKDNDTLEFEGSLAYQNTEIIENVTVKYQFSKKIIEVKELNKAR
ncbi:hypothetical protein CA600_21670 [Paenibacillus sp. VTT E-133280]|jgi:hypothetical protein|uniref:hypothetical protein n=1 Tax=Paenibacillus TaxID=44249 RepID=UPI000BA16AB2|nr:MULTISPECIES: hypothetical protein [unclassified Paenibacillus]MDH6372207.1 hypothetical protein [Paenibacillus sp. PastF-3]OZQ62628.1 hypothetical protein CA600_21670 [Paenibacillus sp. VTT E-133280]